jgi:hypothetical protein
MPSWFPWIFVGGVVFIILSFLGAKYKNKDYKSVQFLQDFISGAILIGFVGILVPDMFPKFEIPVDFPISMPTNPLHIDSSSDIDLQVGPPRLFGR